MPTAFCLRDHHPLPAAHQPADMHIIVNASALSSTVRAAGTLIQNWTTRAGNDLVVECAGAVLEGGDTALAFLSKNCLR